MFSNLSFTLFALTRALLLDRWALEIYLRVLSDAHDQVVKSLRKDLLTAVREAFFADESDLLAEAK